MAPNQAPSFMIILNRELLQYWTDKLNELLAKKGKCIPTCMLVGYVRDSVGDDLGRNALSSFGLKGPRPCCKSTNMACLDDLVLKLQNITEIQLF
jgi:hypothetical protein